MIFCFAYLKHWVLLFITLLVFLVILYLLKLQSKKIIHKPKTKETLKYLILPDIPLKNIDTCNVDNIEGVFLGYKIQQALNNYNKKA